jgi:hypothetical protein
MIRGMICRNSNVAATICLIAWLAGFPSWRTELSARNAPEVSIGNKSTPELTVRVYKFPGLSDWVLNEAYAEAARILRPVPIKLKWVDCTSSVSASCTSPLLPTDLIIRVLANALPQATESALGLASSGESAAAFIFYDRVVAQRTHTRLLPTILGRAMAHEITHLLVPQQDHSDLGLMRREWSADDLGFANSACLGLPIRSIQFMQKEALRRVVSAQSSTLK